VNGFKSKVSFIDFGESSNMHGRGPDLEGC